ncbi:MAG: SDR family oxidoreductase [Novosphingobium sp.]|nr:SDR family oxidoreductase [Novosphingobium sp.]
MAESTGRLAGKTAVVLGASSEGNMGQVIARRLLDEGATVLVSGRKDSVLQQFAAQNGCHWATCDITDEDSVNALADTSAETLGGIDIAINATGWGLLKPFLEVTRAELDAMSALQLVGPHQFFQAMIRKMARSLGGRGGSLMTISSATATIMLNDHAIYMGTKAGTDHIVRCIAHEFGAEGIRANSISPGLTDTPMNAAAKDVPGLFESFRTAYPLGRWGTSEDVAAAVVFLASDECFMTGENLQVNGGLTLRRNPTREEINAAVAKAMVEG